jgi:hypothetical protein
MPYKSEPIVNPAPAALASIPTNTGPDPNTVYIASFYDGTGIHDTRASYLKNGVQTTLSNTTSATVGITVANGDIYVAGYYSEKNDVDRACYWKNGVQTTFPSAGNSFTSAIFVEVLKP